MKSNLLVWEKMLKKYIIFSVPIEKEVTGTDKKGNKITKNISYRDYNLLIVQDLS